MRRKLFCWFSLLSLSLSMRVIFNYEGILSWYQIRLWKPRVVSSFILKYGLKTLQYFDYFVKLKLVRKLELYDLFNALIMFMIKILTSLLRAVYVGQYFYELMVCFPESVKWYELKGFIWIILTRCLVLIRNVLINSRLLISK